MESIFVLTAVAGATELLRRLYAKDLLAALTITASVVIGVVAALLNLVEGLSVAQGVVAGLAASGLVTVASRAGGDGKLTIKE